MAKNTEQNHLEHQKDATAGKRIIRITRVRQIQCYRGPVNIKVGTSIALYLSNT